MKAAVNRNFNGLKLGMVVVLSSGALLAACSKSESPAATENPSSAQSSPTTAKRGQITASIYDRGNIPAEEGTPIKNRWTDWLNQNGPTDVKFVSVPRAESEKKLNLLFASGGAPDLIFEFSAPFKNQAYAQKQLMPLDEPIAKYSKEYKALLEKYPALKKLGMKDDGKLYGLGYVAPLDTNHVLYVRADWLKKLNLEVPETTEDMYKVIKAFADNDPDGNGKKDTFGINLSFVGGQIVHAMFGYSEFGINNGNYVHQWDRAAAAYTFKKQLYDNGLVDKDFLTDSNGEKAQQDFVNGKLGIFGANGGANALGYKVFESFKKNNPSGEIIAIPLPKSSFGQFSPAINPPIFITTVVNAAAKDPEAIMKYVDFLVKESTGNTLKYGLEGTHYKKGANGCPAPNQPISTKEVSWTADYRMLYSTVQEGDCARYISQLDTSKPIDKEFAEIVKSSDDAYLKVERPIYYDIDQNSLPSLPQDLQLIYTNGLKAAADIWSKATVGGASYPIEKALADAKSAWEKAGGLQVDDFYKKWFTDNKASIVLTKDWYTK
ncbi:extracellular solute-binding protein [Paenibacillus hemerocallicola]|uniref:Extracellular solute-binding protein n=1 Tax=Paenibacillus hemerocallicola TaxID=1172614 RepID=A0A5C4T4F6_9BACL|nr:extracellular solute-binding protein [Paenibacillus hemerocallicola]TNJ63958.1 extracellular solute-binding protein [Paenibacillus hemerocallicola]